MKCVFCGRSMGQAAVTLAGMPIGPKCAQRAGLMDRARKGAGLLRLAVGRMPARVKRNGDTLELFPEEDGHA